MAANLTAARKLGTARGREYALVSSFKLGYRSREDVTNLPPGVLIEGSKNVLTNVSERVQIRQGYSLDGAVSTLAAPVMSSFSWLTRGNGEVHMRAGGLTSAGNDGKLQYRYVDSSGNVTWRDLTTGLSTVSYNFAPYWNTTEGLREVLYVNGTSNIYRWNGATATIASTTSNSITKTGTDSWLDTGFYSAGNKSIVINGNVYTYTGGENTTTLTGVSGNPTGEANGSIVHQSVVTTANSAMTGITSTFKNGLIRVMNNQVFVGSLTSSVVWLSKVNDYTNYTGSTPRQAGEGGSVILDQNLTAFNLQGAQDAPAMYASTQDIWYKFTFNDYVNVSGSSGQTFGAVAIKTGRRQGAQSQAMVSSMKNNTICVTLEPTIDEIGVMENYFTQIQQKNISDPIKLDVDSYNFTDGSIFYWRYYILVAIPKAGIVRIFNLNTNSWEAPQTIPVSRFYIVNGELYGHSYNTFESYKLFTGYADRVYSGFAGFPIEAKWVFSYQNYGSRSALKKATKYYVEGYINPNTTLTAKINYELDGCKITRTMQLNGADNQFVCIAPTTGPLGETSLGKTKLGGQIPTSLQNLPPKFRWMPTFTPHSFFECNFEFSCLGTDERVELLAFGLAASVSTELPVQNMG
jgi:hypothetical protein